MKTCENCLRHRNNVNGSHTCTMSQEIIPEDKFTTSFCKHHVGATKSNANVKYRDYEDEATIERTRSCETCKHSSKAYDATKEMDRPYCKRKDSFLVDPELAATLCGWYHSKKN